MLPKRAKRLLDLKRTRYQQGSIAIEERKNGPAVWVYRWRETDTDGQRVKRKLVVGSKADFPTKTAAMRAVDGMKLDINAEVGSSSPTALTVSQVIEHYREKELGDDDKKSMRTKQVYTHQLLNVIAPKWGHLKLREVKPIPVEAWLESMPLAPGSKAKTKGS